MPALSRKLLPDASVISYVCALFLFLFLIISSIVWTFETREINHLLSEVAKIALRVEQWA
jgi:hypothetical protein